MLKMVVKKSRDDNEESMTHVGSVKTPTCQTRVEIMHFQWNP